MFLNCAILRSAKCEHGWNSGEQVSRLSSIPHQDDLSSGVFHPVLLPQEGKIQIKLLTQGLSQCYVTASQYANISWL